MSVPPKVILGTQNGVLGARHAVYGVAELERWLRNNDAHFASTDAMCHMYGVRGEERLWLIISALSTRHYLMQATAERNGAWFALCGGMKSDSELVRITPAELERLREAAAYASFARPILEKLGDKNPLQDI